MNSFHVGPVRLPHPVKMPNGRAGNSNNRAGSADYSLKSTPKNSNNGRKGLRSYSLKYGSTLDDDTVLESKPLKSAEIAQEKPNKVKTVPLYRPKRASDPRMSSAGSCHIAIEEMTSNKASGMYYVIQGVTRRTLGYV